MAKVLRTWPVGGESITTKVCNEIAVLTRGVSCQECVEILFESGLYRRLMQAIDDTKNELNFTPPKTSGPSTVMGFKYRVVYGPGVRPGSMAVITRTEIVFK